MGERNRRTAVVGILAIALAGCGASGARPGASGAPPTASSSPSGVPSPSPSTPAIPSRSSAPGTAAPSVAPTSPGSGPTSNPVAAWRAVPTQASVSGGQWQDVTWTGTQFIAVGPSLSGGGAILDSTDGIHWRSRHAGGASGYPSRIAGRPNGIVAIGRIGRQPASWVSADGVTWKARVGVFPASLDDGDVVTVTDVVATATGWLAVGRDDPVCSVACGQDPLEALAWTSPDGLRWTPVPAAASLQGAAMNAVARTDTGFVAVGTASGRAAIWLSDDGRAWTRVSGDPMFGPPEGTTESAWVDANGVAVVDGTIAVVGMAFGAGDGGAPMVLAWQWDGEWTAAGVERAMGSQVFGVVATLDGFIATGPSSEQGCGSGIWTSSDGLIWGCAREPAGLRAFAPYAATASFDAEVVVGLGGGRATAAGIPGAIWWRPLP